MTRPLDIRERVYQRYLALGAITKGAKVGICGSFGAKSAIVKDADEDFEIRQVITTDDIDLDEEVLDPNGADLSYLNDNKSVFADHNYGMQDSVGRIRWQKRMKGGAGIEAAIRLDSGRFMADECRKIIKSRGTIGASIGFEALLVTPFDRKMDPSKWAKARSIVRKFRVIELSLTCLPCNVSCQTSAYKEDDTKAAEFRELVTKSVIRPETAVVMGFGPRPVKRYEMAR